MFFFLLVELSTPLWASYPICRFILKSEIFPSIAYRANHTGPSGFFPTGVVGIAKYRPFEEILPKSRGVYKIFNPDGDIQYVGSSNDIHKRLQTHLRLGVLQKEDMVEAVVFSKNASQQEVLNYERESITALNPPKNKHPGTPGRSWHSDHIRKLEKFYKCNKGKMTADSREALKKFLRGDSLLSDEYRIVRAFVRIAKYLK